MKLHVQVLQEDIDNGCRGDGDGTVGGGCMVWLALMRASEGSLKNLVVHFSSINWGYAFEGNRHGDGLGVDEEMRGGAILPENVRVRIREFDAGITVHPFEFDLDLQVIANE